MRSKVLKGSFFFDPQDPIYRHHFPGWPVVPGSILIDAFFRVLSHSGFDCTQVQLRDFKFKEFLKPGRFDYIVEFSEKDAYCRILSNERELVSGVICNVL